MTTAALPRPPIFMQTSSGQRSVHCGYVIAERLEPFQFGATAGSFSWVPFLGFMSSSFEGPFYHFFRNFTLWQLDLACRQSWTSALFIYYRYGGGSFYYQLHGRLFAEPHSRDYRYSDGSTHRCALCTVRNERQT